MQLTLTGLSLWFFTFTSVSDTRLFVWLVSFFLSDAFIGKNIGLMLLKTLSESKIRTFYPLARVT